MAIIVPAVREATYLRFDGLRVNFSPERRPDGAWTVPPDRSVDVHVYAYASAGARAAKAGPLWDSPFSCTMEDIGAIEQVSTVLAGGPTYAALAMTPAQIWSAIYAKLKGSYPGASDD